MQDRVKAAGLKLVPREYYEEHKEDDWLLFPEDYTFDDLPDCLRRPLNVSVLDEIDKNNEFRDF
jgi:hypothetical protein